MRASLGLGESWQTEAAADGRIAAVLAYDGESGEHAFAIYEGTGGKYAFRVGGKSSSIQRSVRAFEAGGATALLSMNAPGIAAVVCHGGPRYELDPGRPFVLVIPSGGFDLYDSAGDPVDLARDRWYESTELP